VLLPAIMDILAERVKVVPRRASPKDGIVPKEAAGDVSPHRAGRCLLWRLRAFNSADA
jgi:hypothetical protein